MLQDVGISRQQLGTQAFLQGDAGSPFPPGIQEQLELGISWDSNENAMVLYIYIFKIVIEVHCLVTFLRGIHGDHFTIPNRDHVGLNPEIISMIYLNRDCFLSEPSKTVEN